MAQSAHNSCNVDATQLWQVQAVYTLKKKGYKVKIWSKKCVKQKNTSVTKIHLGFKNI